jgi:hypothetical protein
MVWLEQQGKKTLGNGVKETNLNQESVIQTTQQGRIRTYVGFLRFLNDVKEKVSKEYCTRATKNFGTNPLAENKKIIQTLETECTFEQIMILILY